MTTSTVTRSLRPTIDNFDPAEAFVQDGTAGRFHIIAGPRRYVVATFRSYAEAAEFLYGPPEPPTCSICDAFGHGYPGAGPCPLEETGEDDPRERYLWAMEDLAKAERDFDNEPEYRLAAFEMGLVR